MRIISVQLYIYFDHSGYKNPNWRFWRTDASGDRQFNYVQLLYYN